MERGGEEELCVNKLLEPRWLWAGWVMVGEVVVVTWQVRKDDRKPLASCAREPFGVSRSFFSREEVEGNVEEGAWTWGVRKDDRKPEASPVGLLSVPFF